MERRDHLARYYSSLAMPRPMHARHCHRRLRNRALRKEEAADKTIAGGGGDELSSAIVTGYIASGP